MIRRIALALLLAFAAPLCTPPLCAAPPGMTGGGVSGFVNSVKGDLAGGIAAKVAGTLISGGVKGSHMHVGAFVGVVSAAKSVFDPAFLLGNVPGGVIGGALGSALPLPAILGRMGIAGEMLSFAPPLLGAMFGSALGMEAFTHQKIDVAGLLAQSVGINAMIIAARHLLPALMMGPVNLTEVGAALLGGWIAITVFDAIRAHRAHATGGTLAPDLAGALPSVTLAPKPAADAVWLADRRDDAYRAYVAAEQRHDSPAARSAHDEYIAAANLLQAAQH